MTARAICERHGFGYLVSEGCGYCAGMQEEARAKAAAAPKATQSAEPDRTFQQRVAPLRMRVDKPLLAMVPKRPLSVDECQPQLRKLIEACKRKTGKVPDSIAAPGGFVESEMRWMEAEPGAFSVLSDNAGKFKTHTIKLYAAERRWHVGVDGGTTFLNGLGLDESAWEDAGWQPRREPRREYGFPSKPAAPKLTAKSALAMLAEHGLTLGDLAKEAIEAPASPHLHGAAADVTSMEAVFRREAERMIAHAKRDMEAAYKRVVDAMDRIEAESLATPQAERARKWSETLSHWAPSTKTGESFFGIDRSNAPSKAVWTVHSASGKALDLPGRLIEDPTCPPGMAYAMGPPSDYVDALLYLRPLSLETPGYLLKIKLPEDG
jgi:hypothetical protein